MTTPSRPRPVFYREAGFDEERRDYDRVGLVLKNSLLSICHKSFGKLLDGRLPAAPAGPRTARSEQKVWLWEESERIVSNKHDLILLAKDF